MNPMHRLIVAPLVCFGTSMSAPACAQGTAPSAEAAYADGRYGVALSLLERRAAGGDIDAAEKAGQMLFYGQSVYGSTVVRDYKRAAVYLLQAAREGRPLARYLLERIDRPSVAPPDGSSDPYVPGPHGC